MCSLIVLRRIRVENANAIAGLTWGFPAITHFLGFSHTLSRRLTETHGLRIDGCAVISHEHQIHAHTSGRDYQFALTRNPLTREAKTASFNEEGRMHMTVSLLLECHGEIPNGEYGQRDLAEFLSQVCPTLRLAGGIIVDIQDISVMAMPAGAQDMGRLQWQLMPGFALRDRSSWLGEHHQTLLENDPNATLLDAWLDFAALKIQAETPEDGNIREGEATNWHVVPKPNPGYLVPLMTGYPGLTCAVSQRVSLLSSSFAMVICSLRLSPGCLRPMDLARRRRFPGSETHNRTRVQGAVFSASRVSKIKGSC